jgi:S-ribosylhomocysteine lyase
VDHNKLEKGIYTSRVDGDIVTYDLRMKKPNTGDLLDNATIHTLEHLFATYVRNSEQKDKVIYFGPMGCRTGMYFIVRGLEPQKVIDLIIQATAFIADFKGEIPGNSAIECGNYEEHSLAGANSEAKEYLKIIKDYTVKRLNY